MEASKLMAQRAEIFWLWQELSTHDLAGSIPCWLLHGAHLALLAAGQSRVPVLPAVSLSA